MNLLTPPLLQIVSNHFQTSSNSTNPLKTLDYQLQSTPMAPKKRTVTMRTSVPSKRRASVREATPESSSATQGDSPPSPPSPRIDQLAGKTITTGRKVDFHFFESEGFSIGRLLKEMHWEKICSLDVPTYPALVREFYNDLSRGDGGLISFVRGTRVMITAEILANILDLPTVGICDYQHEDRGGALSRMLGREVNEFEEILANQLNLELRLLHNICGRILFPKIGRFEYVSERDILLMDCILTGQPVNLPGMIIGYMAECATKKRSTLPYGMILTLIFRSQGVQILDNEPLRKLRHTDYYSISTIRRMGFVKADGVWIRKGQEARADEDPVADLPGSPAGPSARPSTSEAGPSQRVPSPPRPSVVSVAPTASTRFSDEQLEQLRQLYAEQDKMRSDEILKLGEELKALKEEMNSKLDYITTSMGSSIWKFSTDLESIFKRLEGIADGSRIYTNAANQLRRDIDFAIDQIGSSFEDFKKVQKDDIMEMIGHLKKIVFKHT